MRAPSQRPAEPCDSSSLNGKAQAGFAILRQAYDYAADLDRPVWDFAVEIQDLRALGFSNNDLRWLVCQGLVEAAVEVVAPKREAWRTFRQSPSLTFTERTCFVLTPSGLQAASDGQGSCMRVDRARRAAGRAPRFRHKPHWNGECQELCLGELIIKRFKVPAPNQERILAVFEEEKWPRRVDDPLPPCPDLNAKRRLHDTIVTLNRHQENRLIRFSGDGRGQGVQWDWV